MRNLILISQIIIVFLLSSCIKKNLPVVRTLPVTDTTWEYVMSGGEVIDEGSSPVIRRGVCISTTNPPTVVKDDYSSFTVDSSGPGIFMSKVFYRGTNNVVHPATRYLRAYATNNQGTAYGEVLTCFPKYKPKEFATMRLDGVTSTTASFTVELKIMDTAPAATELDLCFGTNPAPTIDGDHISILNTSSYKINYLLPNTTYYVRGYVKNLGGTTYSSEISFATWEGEIADKSGNNYQIKTIGNHIWTIQNLETTKFDDGSDIPLIQDDLLWGSTTTSAYCKYIGFGKLYNYFAVVDSRNLCPAGWHVSTDTDWKSLEMSLGMNQDQADATGARGTTEGGKLKFVSSIYKAWNGANVGATNSSGFSAFGAGYRSNAGIFTNEYISANFWTSSEYDATSAWSRSLNINDPMIVRLSIMKGYGFSVRCVKD